MLSNNNFCMFSFNSISALVTGVCVRYIELIDANKSLRTLSGLIIISKDANVICYCKNYLTNCTDMIITKWLHWLKDLLYEYIYTYLTCVCERNYIISCYFKYSILIFRQKFTSFYKYNFCLKNFFQFFIFSIILDSKKNTDYFQRGITPLKLS